MANYFPIECVSALSIGTSVAGLTMNAARAVILLIFGSGEEKLFKGTMLFFVIAAIVVFYQTVNHTVISQTDFYKSNMNKTENDEKSEL